MGMRFSRQAGGKELCSVHRHFPFPGMIFRSTERVTNEITKEERKVKPGEIFVLISQDCDIKASVEKEPYVEALICKRYNQKFVDRVSRTSARWFVINPTIGLVAEAKYRLSLAKRVLSQLLPESWPRRFQSP